MIFRFQAPVKIALGFATMVAALGFAGSARADNPSKPFSRAEATQIIAEARQVVNANGIERLEKGKIGGIEQ